MAAALAGLLVLGACSNDDAHDAGTAQKSAVAQHRPSSRAASVNFFAEPGETTCKEVGPAPDALPGAQSVVYRTASDRPLRLFIFAPTRPNATPASAVLFFFGGGWRSGSAAAFADQARAFAAQGYVAVIADYRVSCRDGTTPLAAVTDARAAYRWLRKHASDYGIAPKHIVLSGGAAGGQLALVTAMEAQPDKKPVALVLFNPVVDMVTPARWYMKPLARQISPSALPIDGLPPTMIFHGEADHRVPIDTVRAFCAKARSTRGQCDVQGYPGEDHGFYHRHTVAIPPVGASGAVAVPASASASVSASASASTSARPATPPMTAADDGKPSPFDDTTARALAFVRRHLPPT